MDSYLRRQTWLQRGQAVQVLNAYAEAMGGGKNGKDAAAQSVPADDLFRMMGVKVKHGNGE